MSKTLDQPVRHHLPAWGAHYLVRETDLERIDGLIGALGLAISQILSVREIRERMEPQEEMPAVDDYTSQVELVLQEAERQMEFPGPGFNSDF